MKQALRKQVIRRQRKRRVRKKVCGTAGRPRMSVYRSLKHCYAQLIDDVNRRTIIGLSTQSIQFKSMQGKTGNIVAAKKLGQLIAEIALEKNISTIVFDRNGCLYHGRVKALAEGAREKGLKF